MFERFWGDCRAAVMIEFAFIFPILLLLTFPMIDYARYILLQQKVIKVAYVLGDAITMSRPIEVDTKQTDVDADSTYLTEKLLNDPVGPDLMDSLPQLLLPFTEPQGRNDWQVVVSHVRKPDDTTPPLLTWQFDEDSRSFDAGGRKAAVGVVSGFNNTTPANLPAELLGTMQAEEDVIVVQVTAKHVPITPILSALGIPFVSQDEVVYSSYMRARYGDLSFMWSNNCPPTSTNCP